MHVKKVCVFHLILVVNLSILMLSVKNRVRGKVLLNRQNLLSVRKDKVKVFAASVPKSMSSCS